jgi:ribosomal protein L11 methyltransferase
VEFRRQDLAELAEAPFQFIFANLLSDIICRNRDLFGRMLTPGGRLLLSGILVEEEERVRECFAGSGWRLLETARDGEWAALALEKTGT